MAHALARDARVKEPTRPAAGFPSKIRRAEFFD